MSDVFISYARSTAMQAQQVAEALRSLGHGVWLDDDLPAHRAYTDVIEERLKGAKAVVVIWSAEAAKSHWVRAEANTALERGTLVQLSVDGVMPPMPFNQIQCADLDRWTGDPDAPGWRKVAASVADLTGEPSVAAASTSDAPPPLPSKPSIAVMPFANLSGDPEQEYFVDGMTEEIVNALSRFKSIFVIASGSTMSFKGKTVAAHDAARLLGVRYILEGSVRRAADRVRILVRLIDPSDGSQIWGDRFEDSLQDVFALQDKVALSVAGAIEPALEALETRRALRRPTNNMGSYDLLLRAATLMQTQGKEELFEALDLLARAVALDPGFARALAAQSACHGLIYSYRLSDDPDDNRRSGVDLAHRALRLASDDPDVLSITAFSLSLLDEDYNALMAQIDRAITLNPGSSMAWYFSSLMRLAAGDPEAGFEHAQTSLRLDPLSPNKPAVWMALGCARFEQGRYADAVVFLEQAAQRVENPDTYAYLAACRGHLGETRAARQALAHYRALSPQGLDDLAAVNHRDLGHRKLFLDGIALAEGKIRVAGPTSA